MTGSKNKASLLFQPTIPDDTCTQTSVVSMFNSELSLVFIFLDFFSHITFLPFHSNSSFPVTVPRPYLRGQFHPLYSSSPFLFPITLHQHHHYLLEGYLSDIALDLKLFGIGGNNKGGSMPFPKVHCLFQKLRATHEELR